MTIEIDTTLESETLTLPQLKPLLGKHVKITVTEQPDWMNNRPTPPTVEQIQALANLIEEGGFDFDSVEKLREISTT